MLNNPLSLLIKTDMECLYSVWWFCVLLNVAIRFVKDRQWRVPVVPLKYEHKKECWILNINCAVLLQSENYCWNWEWKCRLNWNGWYCTGDIARTRIAAAANVIVDEVWIARHPCVHCRDAACAGVPIGHDACGKKSQFNKRNEN